METDQEAELAKKLLENEEPTAAAAASLTSTSEISSKETHAHTTQTLTHEENLPNAVNLDANNENDLISEEKIEIDQQQTQQQEPSFQVDIFQSQLEAQVNEAQQQPMNIDDEQPQQIDQETLSLNLQQQQEFNFDTSSTENNNNNIQESGTSVPHSNGEEAALNLMSQFEQQHHLESRNYFQL